MWLVPKDGTLPSNLAAHVGMLLSGTRFQACIEIGKVGGKPGVKVHTVRLKRKKDYCGQHAGPCQNTLRKRTRSSCLEGLDWVGFNAFLNDTLDKLNADCDVFSFNRESRVSKYLIRRGRKRRVRYSYEVIDRFALWTQGDLDYDFEDHCGKPPSVFDEDEAGVSGTPGYPGYDVAGEAEWLSRLEEYEHAH